ncbi:Pathogenesis-related protein [Thalictrum thalictroides]|uniref:Pathogenesis-related protein n=1 Tax=Thalictrum thalictroides TaxID=46969 RepID=A0A7J6W6J1_THATH|nr:Pathogenesis-related protein [Thalictrum thalictroides]
MDSFIPLLITLVALTMYTTTLGISTLAPVVLPLPPSEFLLAHNKARSAVGVGPLQWSKKLANDTSRLVRYQRNKMSCNFAEMKLTKYGMNQFWASYMAVTPRTAVESWVEKKKYYNHTTNTCAKSQNCGVYKQVVWRKSIEFGCAQAKCSKDHVTLTICLYDPPGNVIGQKPY